MMNTLPPKEIKAEEIAELLRTKYAIFTGGHDREFRSLIIFPDYQTEQLPDASFVLLMQYLSTMNSMHASVHSFVILIDRRAGDWNSVKRIVNKLNATFPVTLDHIFIIKPQGFLQRFFVEKTMAWIRDESRYPISFVDKLEDLFPFIDSAHLPTDMGGQLLFTMDNWLSDRMVVQHILDRYFHGLSGDNVPLQFEEFRDRVTALCRREQELLDQLRQAPESPTTTGSKLQVYEVNPLYAPPLVSTFKKRRRKLLDTITQCEADGLKLRQTLRDGGVGDRSHSDGSGDGIQPGPTVPTAGTPIDASKWTHADPTFDLPVDRVFHVINLEHILVRLTEARAQFNTAWRQFTKRAGVAKLMADIEQRFEKLEPLSSLWDNLLESASDYHQPNGRTTVRQSAVSQSMRRPVPAPSLPRRPSFDASAAYLATSPVTDTGAEETEKVCLEDLQAIVNRLTEAEQLGTRLVPELSALSKTSSWLISYVKQTAGARPHPETSGIDALTRFTFHLDSDNDNSEPEDSDSPTGTHFTVDSPINDCSRFPALKLPPNADQWPVLFDKLLVLAQTRLPNTVDQLTRLAQLYSEMEKARSWIHRGSELVRSVMRTNNDFGSWSLDECRTHLGELTAFYASREEDSLKTLTDPKLFHSRFSGIVNAELRDVLMELLRQVEDVEEHCQAAIAALRQHISRTSFPRHQNSSQSPSSPSSAAAQGTSIPDSTNPASPSRTSPNVQQDTRSQDIGAVASATRTPRSSPVRTTAPSGTTNGFARSQSSDTATTSPVNRFRLAWDELVETERSYVNFLQCVYDIVWFPSGYATESGSTDSACSSPGANWPPPPFMRENQGWLLVNWPELLCFHRDYLLPSLECTNTAGIKLSQWACQVAPRMVDLYSVYCSLHDSAVQVAVQLERDRVYANWINTCNERVHSREQTTNNGSNSVVPDVSDPMRPVLRFSSRLVTPVQRFQRYHLLIERLLRLALSETDKNDLIEAHKTMLHVCETVNLTMRFRGLSIRPSELGRLLLRGDFTVSRDDSRVMSSQQRHVFLFTNAMLLTKFRASATTNTPILTSGSSSSIPPLGVDFSIGDGRERAGSNSSLPSSSSLPLVSNLANLAKSHILTGGSSNTANSNASSSNESGPVYEIRQELLLAQIGLTPSVRADRRRFAIWTANRAQTYIFNAGDSGTRDRWVHSINDLLMAQLRRLRDEALQRHGTNPKVVSPLRDRKPRASSQTDRSCSLPVSSKMHFAKDPTVNASVLSLPTASGQTQLQTVRKKTR